MHSHHHGQPAERTAARYVKRLVLALVLTMGFFVVEVVAGFLSNSLALLSDAGHMFTDGLALSMSLAAIHLANRSDASRSRTFGLYRLEILAAFVNALLLSGVALFVMVEAVRRLVDGPTVETGPMLVVAALGLAVNLAGLALLRSGARASMSVKSAYIDLLADGLGSLGVIVAAVVIGATGWDWVDPAVAAAIGVLILPRTWALGSQAVRVLVQAAPAHIDPEAVKSRLAGLAGVVDVHDVHVWTLTSEMEAASAHLMVEVGIDTHGVLDQARHLLEEHYAIAHATLQVEPADHSGCDEVKW